MKLREFINSEKSSLIWVGISFSFMLVLLGAKFGWINSAPTFLGILVGGNLSVFMGGFLVSLFMGKGYYEK